MAQVVLPDTRNRYEKTEGGVDENRRRTANDSVPGYGGVFNAIEKILDSGPALEQVIVDSLGVEADFGELSTRKKRK